jgi:hypothetical protein
MPLRLVSVSAKLIEVDCVMIDATRITYRQIQPQYAAALRRFHRRLSQHSIHLCFFGAKPELSARKADYFTNVDGVNSFALVALDPEDPDEMAGSWGWP